MNSIMSNTNRSLTRSTEPMADGAGSLGNIDFVPDMTPYYKFARPFLHHSSPSTDMVETQQFPIALSNDSSDLRVTIQNAPASQNFSPIGFGGNLPLPRFILLNKDQYRDSPHGFDNDQRDSRTGITSPASSSTSIAAHTNASTSPSPNQQPPHKKQKPIPRSRRRKPNFAEKLHAVLSNKECRDIVSWMPSGRAFVIKNKADFAKKILPKYLREAKLESFFRRLKRWEFRKVYGSEPNKIVFEHDVFHRDLPELCKTMNGRDTSVKDGGASNQQQRETDEPRAGIARVYVPVDDPRRNPSSMSVPDAAPYSNGGHFPPRELGLSDFARNDMIGIPQRGTPPFLPMYSEELQTMMPSSNRRGTIMNSVNSLPISRSTAFSCQLPRPMEMVRTSMEQTQALNSSHDTSPTVMALMALNRDIRKCEERLAILHKFKIMREQRRLLGMNHSC
ncbi:hypothetical protein ACHAXS_001523 [Conticribra weissflogii]